jgi:hypothetical protein
MLDQLTGGHAVDGPVIVLAGRGRSGSGGGWRRGRRTWSAGSHEQDGEEKYATHLPLVAALAGAGKLAAAIARG